MSGYIAKSQTDSQSTPEDLYDKLNARIAELEAKNETLLWKVDAVKDTKKEEEEKEEEKEMKDKEEGRKNTKNTKDNRKCVVVKYFEPVAVFKIPNGLDLEDKSIVKEWYVRYGTLHIYYTNGKTKEIEWDNNLHEEFDYKWGAGEYETGKIEDADEQFWFENESDDEDE